MDMSENNNLLTFDDNAFRCESNGPDTVRAILKPKPDRWELRVAIPERIQGKTVTEIYIPEADTRTFGINYDYLQIPATVQKITGIAFRPCWNTTLRGVLVDERNTFFWSDGKALYSKDKTRLFHTFAYHLIEYTIPEGVRTICENAFSDQALIRKVVLPESIEQIEKGAFRHCHNLTLVNGLDHAKEIAEDAFEDTPFLRISQALAQEADSNKDETLENYDLFDSLSIASPRYFNSFFIDHSRFVTLLDHAKRPEPHVYIPRTVNGLNVVSVELSEGGYIRKGLESIHIPETVTEITGLDFEATRDLKSIVVADDNPVYWSDGKALYSKDKTQLLKIFAYHLYEFKVPEGVRSISEYAFRGQWNLRKIIFPKSLEQIEQYAFYRCINLSTVIGIESVERIEDSAFMETPYWSGERIWIHDDVLKWYAAPGQKVIRVPEGVQQIDAYAFDSKDPVVERIELPSTLKRIDQNAFNVRPNAYWTYYGKRPDPNAFNIKPSFSWEPKGLRKLAEISIPEGVVEIPNELFFRLPALETIRLPASVVSIGSDAFPPLEHPGRTVFHFKAVETNPRNEVFTSIEGILYSKDLTRLIKVPCKYPLSTLTLPDNLETIDPYAFRFNNTIKNVVLPKTCTTISANAFVDCSVENINLENITRIGESAFSRCKLKRACLEKSEVIEAMAFWGCDITSIELPDTLRIIGQSAFSNCPLEQATIPKNVQSVGERAFDSTKHLIIYDSLQADIPRITSARTISVLSATTGLRKFSVSLPQTDTFESAEILRAGWKPDCVFNYKAIDYCFPKLYSFHSKLQTCIIRLKEPIGLSDEAEEQYQTYLKKNSRKALTDLIDRNDMDGFIACSEIGMIKKTNLNDLIEYANKKNALSFSAFLLAYNEKHFGHPKADLHSLSIGSGTRARSLWSGSKIDPSSVVRYMGEDTEIVFPTKLRGRKITKIADREGAIPKNYTALVSVEIPEGYVSIGKRAFANCRNLERVVLPSTLKSIGAEAFAGCKMLKQIILPDAVSEIGAYCFYASGLQSVTIRHPGPGISDSAFDKNVIIKARNSQ